VFAALAYLTLGVRGLAVALVLALLTVFGPRRVLRAGGLLAGAGAATLVLLALANARCVEFSTYLGSSCTPASLTLAVPFLTLVVLVGGAFTIRALRLKTE
jgi:hypothetical protein